MRVEDTDVALREPPLRFLIKMKTLIDSIQY